MRGLGQLVPSSQIAGRTFLDIGCGSGLSALAAIRMGATMVTAVDLDRDSVATARALLTLHAPDARWAVEERSVFDLDPALARHDIVYSWGVLHHTGAMWKAIDRAAAMVAPQGMFALALYHKTPFCGLWRVEKRLYAHGPAWSQAALRGVYKAAYIAALAARGRNPVRYIADYKRNRGMDWHHDVHDWLGGYPYESTTAAELVPFLQARGFAMERVLEHAKGTIGLFGTGCDEFVARRTG